MKRFLTAAAVSVTMFAAGCSNDADPASQAASTTSITNTNTSTIPAANLAFSGGLVQAAGAFATGSLSEWCTTACPTPSEGEIVTGDNGNTVYSITIAKLCV